MYLVFECRKCEHQLYVDVNSHVNLNLVNTIDNIANKYPCPNCGEEPYENWILVGSADSFPGDEEEEE